MVAVEIVELQGKPGFDLTGDDVIMSLKLARQRLLTSFLDTINHCKT